MVASKRPHTQELESKESNCELKITQARPSDGLHCPYSINMGEVRGLRLGLTPCL